MLFQFFAQPFSGNYYKLTRVVSNILDRVYLVVSFTFIQIFDQNFVFFTKFPRLLDTASKFALFSVSGLKDEKFIKKQTYMKTETCTLF